MNFPRLATPQTIISAIRTAVYGTFSAVFALSEADMQMVNAALIGGVLADYITWLIRSVALMPQYILHGCYEGLINLAFGWFLFRYVQTDVRSDPESLAVAFLAFMLVTVIKAAVYATDFFRRVLIYGVFFVLGKIFLPEIPITPNPPESGSPESGSNQMITVNRKSAFQK